MINKNKVLNMFRQIKNKNVYKFLLIFLKFFELTIDAKNCRQNKPKQCETKPISPIYKTLR